jgi:hypothetical protein
MTNLRFPAVLLLTAFLLPAAFSGSAAAQKNGFSEKIESGYDIHARRIEYHKAYIKHRKALDERRHRYQEPRQDMVDGYREQWKNEPARIDYSAGMAGQAGDK